MSREASTGAIDEVLRRRFEAAWLEGRPLAIEDCLPSPSSLRHAASLVEFVCIDLEFAWKQWHAARGNGVSECAKPPLLETYLQRFPALYERNRLEQLARAEYLVRQQFGDRPTIDEFIDRFPQLRDCFASALLLPESMSDSTGLGPVREEDRAAPPSILGDYELHELLGQGGMGAVYKAHHRRLNRCVALKILRAERLKDCEAVARFDREIRAIGCLPQHRNVVLATDARHIGGIHLLVMEFAEGVDLACVVERCGPLRIADACEAVRQATHGLMHIHAHYLVHRDLKPSNLLLTAEGLVKILDLGMARITPGPLGATTELTEDGQVMGTPDFMAPEQWQDTHHVDIRADIYSLGCALYYLLAGKPPFSHTGAEGALGKRDAHLFTPAPALRAVRSDVPAEIDLLLASLLAKSADHRPRNPEVLAERLGTLVHGADLRRLYRDVASRGISGNGEHSRVETESFAPAGESPPPPQRPGTASRVRGREWKVTVAAAAPPQVLLLYVLGTPYAYEAPASAASFTVGRQRRRGDNPTGIGNDFVIRVADSKDQSLHISRRHFRVERSGESYYLTDLSKAGTWLNGRRLSPGERAEIQAGDMILVAGVLTLQVLVRSRSLADMAHDPQLVCQPAGAREQVFLEATLGELTTLDPDDKTS